MRDIILAAYLERAYQNDLHAFRQHFARHDWLRSIDGDWALARFDRVWPTFWVQRHPVAA
jgi:hypothetical protein